MISTEQSSPSPEQPADPTVGNAPEAQFESLIRRLPPPYRPGILNRLRRDDVAHDVATPAAVAHSPHPRRVYYHIEPDGTFQAL